MKKLLNYKFLMTVLASVIVLLEVLVNVFKINININAIISICVAVVGVLITIGLVKKNKDDKLVEDVEDLKELLEENKNEINDEEEKNTDK